MPLPSRFQGSSEHVERRGASRHLPGMRLPARATLAWRRAVAVLGLPRHEQDAADSRIRLSLMLTLWVVVTIVVAVAGVSGLCFAALVLGAAWRIEQWSKGR